MPYELEAELELELEAEFGRDRGFEAEMEWEGAPGCPYEARLKLDPVKPIELTPGRILCPARADAFRRLKPVIANVVEMLDVTIGELVRAREAACRGDVMVGPSDVARCWLQYRLGICIGNKSARTQTSDKPGTVAEVIRRLVRPRNLFAGNRITYLCDNKCSQGTNAWVHVADDGVCLQNPLERINLCTPFWSPAHARFREQTIIHEGVHLTHCASGEEDTGMRVSIGSPECLAQFVVAARGGQLDPAFVCRCGFTNKCGPVKGCTCCASTRNCPTPLPDWRPKR
jgi:hypothetical protein